MRIKYELKSNDEVENIGGNLANLQNSYRILPNTRGKKARENMNGYYVVHKDLPKEHR